MFVLRLLRRDGSRRSAQDILGEVESRFPAGGLGLSREGVEGVVAGALMGARDEWTNGYNAGWKDGAKEVLSSPILLRSVPPSPLHSPGGLATPNCLHNPGQVTLLTPAGQRSQDEKEDTVAEKNVNLGRNSIENLETSAEQTLHHGNDLNNNDAVIIA